MNMLRFLCGTIAGVFVEQNYKLPDIKKQLYFFQQCLLKIEKDLSKEKK